MEITITKSENLKVKPPVKGLPFGKVFTDHMFLMNYNPEQGWHDPRVVPYGPIPFELGTTVFHYGQEMFEGMKAYRTAEGKIQMFRPMENINRMNNSGERLCIPHIPEDMFLNALKYNNIRSCVIVVPEPLKGILLSYLKTFEKVKIME